MRHNSIIKTTLALLLAYGVLSLPIQAPQVLFKNQPKLSDWLTPGVEAVVVNPKGYNLVFISQNTSGVTIGDSTAAYFGQGGFLAASVMNITDNVFNTVPARIPMNGTIRYGSAYQLVLTPGGATAAQFAALAYRRTDSANANAVDTTFSSGVLCQHVSCSGASGANTGIYEFTGLSIPVVAGELGKIKFTSPAWTDGNPTGIYLLIHMFVQLP